MSRHEERVLAFQALFAWDAGGKSADWQPDFSWAKENRDTTFSRYLFIAVKEECSTIDETIKKHLTKWDFNRIGKVELAVLRLGVWSLLFGTETDAAIIIDECVKITWEYAAGESYRFVNGILDAVHKGVKKV